MALKEFFIMVKNTLTLRLKIKCYQVVWHLTKYSNLNVNEFYFLTGPQNKLESYTNVDLESDSEDSDAKVLNLKLKALIFDTIHNIEIVRTLIDSKVTSLSDWAWQKQLRFYMNANKTALIRMVDAEFDYTYEYQGNAPKLVHTPLTDKCYLTLTQVSVKFLQNFLLSVFKNVFNQCFEEMLNSL